MYMAIGITTGVLAFIAAIFAIMSGRRGLAFAMFFLTVVSSVGVFTLSEGREACAAQEYRTAWCG